MKKQIKKSILIISLVVTILVPLFVLAQTQQASAPQSAKCTTIKTCIGSNLLPSAQVFGPQRPLVEIISNIVKFALGLVGTIFTIFIIYAGFMWMTAGGSSEQASKASTTLRNNVIGLLVVVISYALTITVFDIILKSTTK